MKKNDSKKIACRTKNYREVNFKYIKEGENTQLCQKAAREVRKAKSILEKGKHDIQDRVRK